MICTNWSPRGGLGGLVLPSLPALPPQLQASSTFASRQQPPPANIIVDALTAAPSQLRPPPAGGSSGNGSARSAAAAAPAEASGREVHALLRTLSQGGGKTITVGFVPSVRRLPPPPPPI